MHTGEINNATHKCKCNKLKQLEPRRMTICMYGALAKAVVWADDLVNSHILLGIDTTVSSQLVGL